ncbi:galaxin-like [Neolamprologus brichardi]|uniref:galaxin-like n=1 Tax=Neolamprologus brichardi TaxID=32507 RepID=UPI0016437650|nr:galaxin-like [Neolamprologus brichardi]
MEFTVIDNRLWLSVLFRKDCNGTKYNTQEAACCGNKLYPGASLSCCGKKPYNPEKATCCKVQDGNTLRANVTHGLSEKVSNCCGLKPYNPVNEMCCQSTITAKPGPVTECCGKEAFAEDKQLCCGASDKKKILVRSSSFHRCCGHNQYDNRTQCCCENEGVLEVQPKDSSCCDKSSTTGNSLLCTFTCQLWYDNRTQCCCENEGVLEIQPKHSSCCAKESANPEGFQQLTHELQHFCTEPNTHLCGSTCYNPKTHRCCERHQKPFWFCASGQSKARVYDPRIEVCCDGSVFRCKPWIDQFYGSPGQHCCGTEIYRPRTEICCNGHRHPKSENLHCCGVKAYNIKDPQIKCCAGTLYNLTSLDKHGGDAQCCGSILQKPQSLSKHSQNNRNPLGECRVGSRGSMYRRKHTLEVLRREAKENLLRAGLH